MPCMLNTYAWQEASFIITDLLQYVSRMGTPLPPFYFMKDKRTHPKSSMDGICTIIRSGAPHYLIWAPYCCREYCSIHCALARCFILAGLVLYTDFIGSLVLYATFSGSSHCMIKCSLVWRLSMVMVWCSMIYWLALPGLVLHDL